MNPTVNSHSIVAVGLPSFHLHNLVSGGWPVACKSARLSSCASVSLFSRSLFFLSCVARRSIEMCSLSPSLGQRFSYSGQKKWRDKGKKKQHFSLLCGCARVESERAQSVGSLKYSCTWLSISTSAVSELKRPSEIQYAVRIAYFSQSIATLTKSSGVVSSHQHFVVFECARYKPVTGYLRALTQHLLRSTLLRVKCTPEN